MMMEDEIDDLFGDQQLGGITNLPSPSTLPRGLIQRIDDLGISGCSQYVWLPSHIEAPLSVRQENCLVQRRLHRKYCGRQLRCDPSESVL